MAGTHISNQQLLQRIESDIAILKERLLAAEPQTHQEGQEKARSDRERQRLGKENALPRAETSSLQEVLVSPVKDDKPLRAERAAPRVSSGTRRSFRHCTAADCLQKRDSSSG